MSSILTGSTISSTRGTFTLLLPCPFYPAAQAIGIGGAQLDSLSLGTFGEDGVQPRGTARLSCSFISHVRTDGVRNVSVRLCDISELGFMAECSERVPLGGTVSLDLPGVGATHARIRWSMGGRIGGRFMHPIDLDACRAGIAEATNTL